MRRRECSGRLDRIFGALCETLSDNASITGELLMEIENI